jgi:hypothetical protein
MRSSRAGQEVLTVRAGADPCQCMEVSLDKEKYAPGEWGQLRIKTKIGADIEARELRVQVLGEPGPQWVFLTLRLK